MAHICIDGFNIALPHGTGIATYARTLLAVAQDTGHEASVLFGRNAAGDRNAQAREASFFGFHEPGTSGGRLMRALRATRSAFLGDNVAIEIPRTGTVIRDDRLDVGTRIWNSRRLYDAARVRFRATGGLLTIPNPGGVNIAHWTCPLPIRMAGAKNYYTFHDPIPLRYPHLTLDNATGYHRMLRAIVTAADRIVTVSECSKAEIVDHLKVAPDRVVNTSQAVMISGGSGLSHGALRIYGLVDRSYFLAFSAIEPKKNIARTIEAYLLSASNKPLVIAGHFTWLPPTDISMLANLGLWDDHHGRPRSAGSIRFLGHVPKPHLDALIRHATAVMFASITEGFGLPIVEAMGRGTAVITSRGGATEETAGGGALLVDPMDSTSIAAAMRLIESDETRRKALEAGGLARASAFDIQHYRARIAELYRL